MNVAEKDVFYLLTEYSQQKENSLSYGFKIVSADTILI